MLRQRRGRAAAAGGLQEGHRGLPWVDHQDLPNTSSGRLQIIENQLKIVETNGEILEKMA